MNLASKKKGLLAWLLTLLIVSGVFGENRVWGFFAQPQPAPGQIEAATLEAIGENYDASAYDASGYAVAPKTGGVLSNADDAYNRMLQAGQAADKNGLTRAGRALQKHGDRAGSAFPSSTGNAAARNAQGQGVLDGILRAQTQTIKPNRFGGRDIFDAGTGRGVRFDGNGNMMGFFEP